MIISRKRKTLRSTFIPTYWIISHFLLEIVRERERNAAVAMSMSSLPAACFFTYYFAPFLPSLSSCLSFVCKPAKVAFSFVEIASPLFFFLEHIYHDTPHSRAQQSYSQVYYPAIDTYKLQTQRAPRIIIVTLISGRTKETSLLTNVIQSLLGRRFCGLSIFLYLPQPAKKSGVLCRS